jgi:pyrroline-5-carboxylate reductase
LITIIGNGAMAFALAKGIYESKSLTSNIEIVGRNPEKLEKFKDKILKNGSNGKKIFTKELDFFDIENKIILLTVKPYALIPVASKLKGKAKTLYSVLAGTSIESLKNISSENYIRIMPNVSAFYQNSFSLLTAGINSNLSDEVKKQTETIFNSVGETIWLETENELDIGTGISGSGPAYLALVAEAIADGGVKAGLKREVATQISKGLFKSFASLMTENSSFSNIKDSVMSPKGTTAHGYATLEENNTRHAFIKAIENAYNQSQVLKKS